MIVIYLLMPIALLLAGGFLVAFVWMAKDGQFDDLETPPLKMLLGDEPIDRKDSGKTQNMEVAGAMNKKEK